MLYTSDGISFKLLLPHGTVFRFCQRFTGHGLYAVIIRDQWAGGIPKWKNKWGKNMFLWQRVVLVQKIPKLWNCIWNAWKCSKHSCLLDSDHLCRCCGFSLVEDLFSSADCGGHAIFRAFQQLLDGVVLTGVLQRWPPRVTLCPAAVRSIRKQALVWPAVYHVVHHKPTQGRTESWWST